MATTADPVPACPPRARPRSAIASIAARACALGGVWAALLLSACQPSDAQKPANVGTEPSSARWSVLEECRHPPATPPPVLVSVPFGQGALRFPCAYTYHGRNDRLPGGAYRQVGVQFYYTADRTLLAPGAAVPPHSSWIHGGVRVVEPGEMAPAADHMIATLHPRVFLRRNDKGDSTLVITPTHPDIGWTQVRCVGDHGIRADTPLQRATPDAGRCFLSMGASTWRAELIIFSPAPVITGLPDSVDHVISNLESFGF